MSSLLEGELMPHSEAVKELVEAAQIAQGWMKRPYRFAGTNLEERCKSAHRRLEAAIAAVEAEEKPQTHTFIPSPLAVNAEGLKRQWVGGVRKIVSLRRFQAAESLSRLKTQDGSYPDAHRALVAECDKMLVAGQMADELLRLQSVVGDEDFEIIEVLLKKAGVL